MSDKLMNNDIEVLGNELFCGGPVTIQSNGYDIFLLGDLDSNYLVYVYNNKKLLGISKFSTIEFARLFVEKLVKEASLETK